MANNSGVHATAIDLFCGAGGLTRGLLDAGVGVVAGYDIDESCRFPYEKNNKPSIFFKESITKLQGAGLKALYPKGHKKVLVGCAPCQTFSKYTQGLNNAKDPKWNLLKDFGRLVREIEPDIVSMENVPELLDHEILYKFLRILKDLGFHLGPDPEKWIIFCPDYGIPQNRRRLVIVASRLGPIKLLPPQYKPTEYIHVKDVLGDLPRLRAGFASTADPLHRSSRLSEINLSRIRASKPGGTWRDWPEHLRATCHKQKSGKTYASVYGRMEWDKPSPTITTQFYGFGNGRFGHPEQNRGLSLREGALLQSFPRNYEFVEPGKSYHFKTIGRMIGNAVPVQLGTVVGRTIVDHLQSYAK